MKNMEVSLWKIEVLHSLTWFQAMKFSGDLTTKHVDINHQTWGISHKLKLHNREKSGFSKLGQSAGLDCSLAASNTEEILVK